MNVWYAFPSMSIEAAQRCCAAWAVRGYRTAVAVDDATIVPAADLTLGGAPYRGYGEACNRLATALPDADVIVFGGHDVSPDETRTAKQIAEDFRQHFPDLCGVMQPMGDVFGALAPGAERAAVSPWVGRGFIQRAYSGKGPYWPGYAHLYVDAELWCVAERAGVLWQNSTVKQYHDHWQRRGDERPAHLQRALERHEADRKLYETRKAQGFPGAW